MDPFVHDGPAGRVVFGAGAVASVPDELERLGSRRALMIASPSARVTAETLHERLGDRWAGVSTGVAEHVPLAVAEETRSWARAIAADALVALGGGSATGLAKAVAVELDLPILAVPTTYAGSELTALYGITHDRVKHTAHDARALPRVVVYDPELTCSLPPRATVGSVYNALAHCVEAFYAPGANPLTALVAEEGLRVLADALPRVVAASTDLDARSDLLYGAFLAGTALAVGGTALHHRVCHVLGGSFGLGHGDVNAVMLPHALAYNQPCIPDEIARIAAGLGADDPVAALFDRARELGAPTSLAALGLPEAALVEVAELVVATPVPNPRPVELSGIRAMLGAAWRGDPPS